MKQLSLFSIFTFFLLLLAPNLAVAMLSTESTEIPYQINNSDRIVIGTVSKIDVCDYYTNNTITVKEWLLNPLPEKTIIVRTNIGTRMWTEDEAEFTQNESVLLMLNDQRPDEGVFRISVGFPGKHPESDRNIVINELKAQGKWQNGNQTVNIDKSGESPLPYTKINNSNNIQSESNNGSSNINNSTGNKYSRINSIPGIGLFGSLICLYGGWKLSKRQR